MHLSFLLLVLLMKIVRRPWYGIDSSERKSQPETRKSSSVREAKYQPDRLVLEKGAVFCRVSESFLRFSHIELFAMRNEV